MQQVNKQNAVFLNKLNVTDKKKLHNKINLMHDLSIHLSARIGGRVTSGKMLDEHPLLWLE